MSLLDASLADIIYCGGAAVVEGKGRGREGEGEFVIVCCVMCDV